MNRFLKRYMLFCIVMVFTFLCFPSQALLAYDVPDNPLVFFRQHYIDYNTARKSSWILDVNLKDPQQTMESVVLRGPGIGSEGVHLMYLPQWKSWSQRMSEVTCETADEVITLDTNGDNTLEYTLEVLYKDGGTVTYEEPLSISGISDEDMDSSLRQISISRDGLELIKGLENCSHPDKLILNPFGNNTFNIDWTDIDGIAPVEVNYIRGSMVCWISYDESGISERFDNIISEEEISGNTAIIDLDDLADSEGDAVAWQESPVAEGHIQVRIRSIDNPQLSGLIWLDIYPDVAVRPYLEMIRYFNSNSDGSGYDGYTLQKRLHVHSPILKGPLEISSFEAFLGGAKITSIRNYSQEELAESYPFREYGDAVKDGIRFRVYDTYGLVDMDGIKTFEYVIHYEDGSSRTITRDFDFSENTERYPRNTSISYQETNGEMEPLTPLLPESIEKVRFNWDQCPEEDRYGDGFCKVGVDKGDQWFEGIDDLIDSGGGCSDWFITEGTVLSSDIWDSPEERVGWERGDISLVHEYENNTRYMVRFPVATSLIPFPRKVRLSDRDNIWDSNNLNVRIYVDKPLSGIAMDDVEFFITCPELGITDQPFTRCRSELWGNKYDSYFEVSPDIIYGHELHLTISSAQNSWEYVFDLTSIPQRPYNDAVDYSYSTDGLNWHPLNVSRKSYDELYFKDKVPNDPNLSFKVSIPSPWSDHAASTSEVAFNTEELNWYETPWTWSYFALDDNGGVAILDIPTDNVRLLQIEPFVKIWEDEAENNFFAYDFVVEAKTQIYDEGTYMTWINLVEEKHYSWNDPSVPDPFWHLEFWVEQDMAQTVHCSSTITDPWSEYLPSGKSMKNLNLNTIPSNGEIYPIHFFSNYGDIGPDDQGIYDLHCYESDLNGIEVHTYYSIDPYIDPDVVPDKGIEFTDMCVPSNACYLAVEIADLPLSWCHEGNLNERMSTPQYTADGVIWTTSDWDSVVKICKPEYENRRHLMVLDLKQIPGDWSQLSFSQGTGPRDEYYNLLNSYTFCKVDSPPLPINNYGLIRNREIPLRGEPYCYWMLLDIDVSSSDEYIDSIEVEGPGIQAGYNDHLTYFSGDSAFWTLCDLPTWETADLIRIDTDPDGFLRYILTLNMKNGTTRQGLVEIDVSSIQDSDYDPYLNMISVKRGGVELNRNVNSLAESNVQVLDPTNMANSFDLDWGDAVSGSGLDFWRLRGRLWSSICLPSGRHERLENMISDLSETFYTLNMNTGALRSDPQTITDWRDLYIKNGAVEVFLSDSLKPGISSRVRVQVVPDFVTSSCQIIHSKIYRDSGDHISFGSPSLEKGFLIDGTLEQGYIPGKAITNVETTIAGLPLAKTGSGNNWHFETDSSLEGDLQQVKVTVDYQDGTSRTMSYDFNTTTDESLFADTCDIQYKLDNQDQYKDIIPRIQKDVSCFSYSFEEQDIFPTCSEAFARTNDSFTTISVFEDVDGDATELTSSQVWSDHGFDRANWEIEKLGVSCTYYNSLVYSTVYEVLPPLNQSPQISATISPSHGAAGVSIYPELSWSAIDPEGLDLTHKLYFSSSSMFDENDLVYTTTEPSGFTVNYDALHLQPDRTYYWKVIVSDGENETSSSCMSFTTTDVETLVSASEMDLLMNELEEVEAVEYDLGGMAGLDLPEGFTLSNIVNVHKSDLGSLSILPFSVDTANESIKTMESTADTFSSVRLKIDCPEMEYTGEVALSPLNVTMEITGEKVGKLCMDAIREDYNENGDLAVAIFSHVRPYVLITMEDGTNTPFDLAAMADLSVSDEEALIRFFDVWEDFETGSYHITVPLVVADESYSENPVQAVQNDFESYFVVFDGTRNNSFDCTLSFATILDSADSAECYLVVSHDILYPGEEFNVQVWINAGESEFNALDIFLDFASQDLHVRDGEEIEINPIFDLVLNKNFSNDSGEVDISCAIIGNYPVSGDIMVCTVPFVVLNSSNSASICFSENVPRNSTVVGYESNSNILERKEDLSLRIDSCVLEGSITFVGLHEPLQMEIPVELSIVFSDELDQYDHAIIPDVNGDFRIPLAKNGNCSISINSERMLRKIVSADIISGINKLDLGELPAGDATDDNTVNIFDFSLLARSYRQSEGEELYDARADFNRDSTVNIFDFSILARYYRQIGAEPLSGIYKMDISTGGSGGTYYSMGSAIADVISVNSQSLAVNAVTGMGSVVNLRAVNSGDVEMGIAQSDVVFNAAWKDLPSENPLSELNIENVRSLAYLHSEEIQLIVGAESNITSYSDLAGKTVGVSSSISQVTCEDLLRALSMDPDSVNFVVQDSSSGLEDVGNGTLDAFVLIGAYPVHEIEAFASGTTVQLIGITPEQMTSIDCTFPYIRSSTIPGNTYTGVSSDVTCPAIPALLFCNADLSDLAVYEFMTQLWANMGSISLQDPKAEQMCLDENLETTVIQLHPGAFQYYREQQ